jgi:putative redox protein
MQTTTKKVSFKGSQDRTLKGRLELPLGTIQAYAIFVHCFTCTKDFIFSVRLCRFLAEQGIAVLRFDFAGLGESEGDFAETNFSSNVDDILGAFAFLSNEYQMPQLLMGHSLGGTAALVAASKLPALKGVATINSPCHPQHVKHHFTDVEHEIMGKGESDVLIEGRAFKIQKHFFDDLESYNMEMIFKDINAALLVLHSPQDETVSVKNASYIFSMAHHPKSFISLDNADHLITKELDAQYAARVIAAWAFKYQKAAAEEENSLRPENQVEVFETGVGVYSQRIQAGVHTLTADEPPSVEGGMDTGPSPYNLLLASLGACTSITMRMYARLKNLPLTSIKVALNHRKERRDEKDVVVIDRAIEVQGDLSEDQQQSLLKIANKCPVHKAVTEGVNVQTSLKKGK